MKIEFACHSGDLFRDDYVNELISCEDDNAISKIEEIFRKLKPLDFVDFTDDTYNVSFYYESGKKYFWRLITIEYSYIDEDGERNICAHVVMNASDAEKEALKALNTDLKTIVERKKL